MNDLNAAKINPYVGISKYLLSLWPLPVILLLMQLVASMIRNPIITQFPSPVLVVTPLFFVITFAIAAYWIHLPVRQALKVSSQSALEMAMSTLLSRAIRSFTIAGLVCIMYTLSVVFISSLFTGLQFSPRMLIALGFSIIFEFGVLMPTLAIALTTAWMARTRKKLSGLQLFIGNLEQLSPAPWLIRSSNRPWLIFAVTSFIPVCILGFFTWLMLGTTHQGEQHFILMQAITLVFSLILSGVPLVFVTSKTMNRITRELTLGLNFLRQGKFDGHVAVMVDGDMGDLARGLNTALTGLKESDNLKDSLAIASDIQRGLMPREEPRLDAYALSGFQQSCYSVGGDYYDYIQRSNGTTWLIIADVAGKGYPAALTVANLQAMLHALANAGNISLLDAARYINQSLTQTLQGGRFVTMFIAELNPQQHTLEWLNAGHIPPLLWQNQQIMRLETTSPPLGVLASLSLHTETLHLAADDVMFSCTDGITEARNDEAEMFADHRLDSWFSQHHTLAPAEMPSSLLSFLDEEGFSTRDDDITMLCLKRRSHD